VEKTRIDNLLLSGNQQGNSSDMLNVMTFNIRYGLAEDGENHWNKRKGLVIERIQAFDPDLLGIQECRDDEQAEFIRSSLPEHHFFGVRRASNDSTALEMAPILFRKSCFEPIQSGCFWLSQTPDVAGSKSWDSTFRAYRNLGRTLPHPIGQDPGLSQHPFRLPAPGHRRRRPPAARLGQPNSGPKSTHHHRRFQCR
jgi:hypothetical protein